MASGPSAAPPVALMYAFLCLVWGSTWLAIKVGLEGIPPFLGAGLRFALASIILWVAVAARRTPLTLSRDDRISILSLGLLGYLCSFATVYWAEQYLPSGLAAVIFSSMPLMVALLNRFWMRTEPLSARQYAGILAGVAGTAILFWPRKGIGAVEARAMLVCLAGNLCASVNLVVMRRHSRHSDIYLMSACAMGLGSSCLMGISALTERAGNLEWTRESLLALLYLTVFGSCGAFLVYARLIKVMEATPISMISLVTPVVALILGWAFMGEKLSSATLAGTLVVLAGVAIALVPRRKKEPAPLQP